MDGSPAGSAGTGGHGPRAPLTLSYAAPTRLTIGTDGVPVAWLGRIRFIAYEEIVEVGAPVRFDVIHDLGVRIAVRAGQALVLAVGGGKAGLLDATDKHEALLARLYAARRAYGAAPQLDVRPLVCGGREPSVWLAALMRVASGADIDARTAPTTVEWIWQVVASPRAPVEARVAAAVALRVVVGEPALAALRAAAAGLVAPDARSLVEAAVDGEPVNILAAMT